MKKIKSIIRFPAFVAKKYLLSRGEPRFTSFLTLVAVCGVAVGIAALIVVISVMTGFGNDLRTKLMGFNPHVTVVYPAPGAPEIADKIKTNYEEVLEIDQFVEGEVIIKSDSDHGLGAVGAKILGIDRIPERMIANAEFYWGENEYDRAWFNRLVPPIKKGVILGNEMLYLLNVFPDFRDEVQLISPFGGIDPLGNPIPKRREYAVVGGFKSGFFEYDIKYALLAFDEAKKLLRSQGRYGLQIMINDSNDADEFVKSLQNFLGPTYTVSSWTGKNKRLFAALKLEKVAMTCLLFLIIVIASFSIVGVVLMIFFAKRRDLAILMSVGSSRKNIESIFLIHGGLIGSAGAILGSLLGLVICLLIKRSNIVLPPSYYLDYLPVSINIPMILLMACGGIIISLLAAYYPARRAAQTDPIQLLRYE